MRTLSSFMKGKKNLKHLADAFLWLFDIRRDSSNVSRYVKDRRNHTFFGNSYMAKAMTFEPPSADSGGSQQQFKISIDNTDRVEVAYLELGKYFDQDVEVRIVNTASRTNEDDQIVFRGTVQNANCTEKAATLECGGINLRDYSMPNERLNTRRCRHQFKGPCGECGYSGGETTCDKLLSTCTNTMNNRTRWGGASTMPIRRAL